MHFTAVSTEALWVVRRNLLKGIDRVAEHIDAGTQHDVPDGHEVSAAEFGCFILALLVEVDHELASRVVTP
jgi:hypothetical protein